MKFLVVGLGSMGKRRVRNLINLGHNKIYGFDIREDRRKEARKKYKIEVCSTIEACIDKNPDILIISTSPNAHLEYVKIAARNDIPFFTEVNTSPQDIKKIISIIKRHKIVGISSMTMKFHPAVKIIKKIIDSKKLGEIYFLNYHSGENLSDWHPWERIQDYYVSNINTGGGRDQAVYEFEWIFWIFGKPKELFAKTEKLSRLPAKIYDMYNVTFALEKSPITNVMVDLIQRPPNRLMRIVCENGLITWDWIEGLVRVYNSKIKKWEEYRHGEGYKGFNAEEMYQEELHQVINSIINKKNNVSSFEHEYMTAKAVIMCEESSRKNRRLKITKNSFS